MTQVRIISPLRIFASALLFLIDYIDGFGGLEVGGGRWVSDDKERRDY